MKRLRILSYNIHGGRTASKRRPNLEQVRAVLERLDIDIAVFQEMETRSRRHGALSDEHVVAGEGRPYRLRGESLRDGQEWYGNFLVSRYPIKRGLVHNLETKPDFEPRNAVDALIATPLGDIRVIGTHLSLSYIERFSEARNLLRLMQAVEQQTTAPLFLLGDINEWQPFSKLLRYLDDEMAALPMKPTFPAYAPLLKLDRAWHDTPQTMQVYAHRMAGKGFRTLSDHLPIVLEVTV